MGNEFGHPEWIDFPREGNQDSFDHCRRQWNLMYDPKLRYRYLAAFDQEMNRTEALFKCMLNDHQHVSKADEGAKVIVYERGHLLFAFNFHSTASQDDYEVGTLW